MNEPLAFTHPSRTAHQIGCLLVSVARRFASRGARIASVIVAATTSNMPSPQELDVIGRCPSLRPAPPPPRLVFPPDSSHYAMGKVVPNSDPSYPAALEEQGICSDNDLISSSILPARFTPPLASFIRGLGFA